MRTKTLLISIAALAVVTAGTPARADTWSGTVQAGGVFIDETGDRSVVQETFDLYDGFALSRIHLSGRFDSRSSLQLDLRDINLRSRSGDFVWRTPGRLKLSAGYDQSRFVFDPGRGVTAERRDWKAGLRYTPRHWLSLSASANHLTREGERLPFPPGSDGALGDRYDAALTSGELAADVRQGARGGGLSYRISDYADDPNPLADRRGQVVAGRLFAPLPFYAPWTNFVRASYGTLELTDGGVERTLLGLQYTAVIRPADLWEMRYAFTGTRVEDDATALRTDRFQNDVDLAWLHRYGRVNAGYGYEMNDDDRTLTSYHSWRAGATLRPSARISARVDYAERIKRDEEELTLLKDIESARVRAKLELRPVAGLTLAGDYANRTREFPDIGVSADGTAAGGVVRYERPGWAAVSADYSHSVDEYVDRLAGFETESQVVTGRLEIDRFRARGVTLAGGVTYLDIRRDLDIEKSIVFAEGALRLAKRYTLQVKYDCFNYDDYVLIDRYYTANVVRIDLGYDL